MGLHRLPRALVNFFKLHISLHESGIQFKYVLHLLPYAQALICGNKRCKARRKITDVKEATKASQTLNRPLSFKYFERFSIL